MNMKTDETNDMPSFAKEKPKKCNANPVAKYVRIALSLAVIAMGIIYKNPVGLLGLMTLFTALKGNCGSYLRIGKPSLKLKLDDVEPRGDEKTLK